METVAEEEPGELAQPHEEREADLESDTDDEAASGADEAGEAGTGDDATIGALATINAAVPAVGASGDALGVGGDKETTSDGPARLFRSGKGPAEQAYELFLKEMAQWKEAQIEEAARQKQQQRAGGHHGRGKATRLASLDLDSSGSDTDLEDVTDPSKESWAGLDNGLAKLYDRACATYQVTSLTQFKYQLSGKFLSVTNMSLRHRDIAAMCIPLQHKDDLTYIDLSGNLIGYKGLASLLDVIKEFRHLGSLDLSNNSLGGEAAQLLASKVDNLRTLKMLNLTGNGFLERDAEYITSLITQLEGLRTLNISSNTFGSHGGELIGAALKTNANLETLNLSCCEIRMQGAVAIGMALKDNGSLDSLDISYNGFSDLGAKAIAESLKTNAALTVLNLTSNRIFVEGAKAIGAMLRVNETLKELYLDKNSFTCDGAQDILAMLKENENTALKMLDMKSVSVTYKTAAAVLPTLQQPLLVRLESFVQEFGGIRDQLDIPTSRPRPPDQEGGSTQLSQKLQAQAAHVLQVFTRNKRMDLIRFARKAVKAVESRHSGGGGGGGGGGSRDGELSEAEMRELLKSLPIKLLPDEVDSLVDSIKGEPDQDGNYTFSLNSLLNLGESPQARLEVQH